MSFQVLRKKRKRLVDKLRWAIRGLCALKTPLSRGVCGILGQTSDAQRGCLGENNKI
jgi:hypothetical protein